MTINQAPQQRMHVRHHHHQSEESHASLNFADVKPYAKELNE